MPNTFTVDAVLNQGDTVRVIGRVVFTGSYTAGAGNAEALNFQTAVMAKLAAGLAGVPSNELPLSVKVTGRTSGITVLYTPGTTRDNGKMRFFTTANTELTGAPTAFPAYITGDTFDVEAIFRKLI